MLTVTVTPAVPYIEAVGWSQQVNCDFRLANHGAVPLRLDVVRLTIIDEQGQVAWRRQLDRNAIVPGILTVGETTLSPGGELLIFNPFHTLPPDLPLCQLVFTFELTAPDSTIVHSCEVSVQPVPYQPSSPLVLPLAGRLWVSDGHDFYGHERRVDLAYPALRQLGVQALASRYASDLVVDASGAPYAGDPARPEHWHGFGAPVTVTGAGVVMTAVDGLGGLAEQAEAEAMLDPTRLGALIFGNHVVLDHGDGAYSLMAHLQPGSVQVRANQRVTPGQWLGRLGASGDSLFPHLHYHLSVDPAPFQGEGLPAYFQHFRRLRGATLVAVTCGVLEAGEFVESTVTVDAVHADLAN
jgi:hypothetical protein